MSTKFFAQNDEFSSDEEPKEVVVPKTTKVQLKTTKKVYKKGGKKDDEDEEKDRVVRSEKAKRLANLIKITQNLKQLVKIQDYEKILADFEGLQLELKKSQKLIDEDGHPSEYLRAMVTLENLVAGVTTDQKKKMQKNNAKAFTKLKQNLGKSNLLIKEQLDLFKSDPKNLEEVEESEEEPVEESEEEEEESGSDSEESDSKSESSNSDSQSGSDKDNEESGSDSDSESESGSVKQKWDSDSEEEIDTEIDMEKRKELAREERRKFWLKKVVDKPMKEDKPKKAHNKKIAKDAKDKNYEVVQFEEFEAIELIPSNIQNKMLEIANNRAQLAPGDIAKAIKTLEYILEHEEKEQDDIKQMEIIIILVNLRNELNQNAYMDRDMWFSSTKNLQTFLSVLIKYKTELNNKVTNYLLGDDKKYLYLELEDLFRSNVMAIDYEWNSSVRLLDQHDKEYDLRLRDEMVLLRLMNDSVEYFEVNNNEVIVSSLSFRILEHIYQHSQYMVTKIRERVEDYLIPQDSQSFIRKLAANVYAKPGGERYVTKTALYEAYNYAINDEYTKAKDLLLMSKIPDTNNEGTLLMVYNRVLVQLGICAFRKGMIYEAKEILDEICTQLRVKEMLGQTMPKTSVREDKRKLFPYHLHISFETVESVYLMCVLLIEVPFIVSGEKELDKRNVNKLFQKLWNLYEKNEYNGPPENHKDFIYGALKELAKGNWKECFNYLGQLKCWIKMSNSEEIKAKILEIVKQQAFKSFIFAMKSSSHTLRFEHLEAIFELSVEKLCSITCKMIRSRELKARLDYETKSLIIGQNELTLLESLSNTLTSKITVVQNINEKLFDAKFVGVGYQDISATAELVQTKKNKRNYIIGGKKTNKPRRNH